MANSQLNDKMSKPKKEDNNNRRLVIIIILVLIIGLFTTLVVMNTPKDSDRLPEPTQPESEAGLVIKESDATAVTKQTSYIAIPGFSGMTINSNTYEQEVDLYNPDTNTVTMNMKIGLLDGSQIWSQDGIKPGDHINTITLTRLPEPGKYNAALIIDCYLPDGTKVNGGVVQFELNVI